LQLLAGCLTPRLQEQLTRLGAWMPFEKAAVMFQDFTRVVVSEDYAQQHTEDAGPAKQCLSADGAMVPLVGGE